MVTLDFIVDKVCTYQSVCCLNCQSVSLMRLILHRFIRFSIGDSVPFDSTFSAYMFAVTTMILRGCRKLKTHSTKWHRFYHIETMATQFHPFNSRYINQEYRNALTLINSNWFTKFYQKQLSQSMLLFTIYASNVHMHVMLQQNAIHSQFHTPKYTHTFLAKTRTLSNKGM